MCDISVSPNLLTKFFPTPALFCSCCTTLLLLLFCQGFHQPICDQTALLATKMQMKVLVLKGHYVILEKKIKQNFNITLVADFKSSFDSLKSTLDNIDYPVKLRITMSDGEKAWLLSASAAVRFVRGLHKDPKASDLAYFPLVILSSFYFVSAVYGFVTSCFASS